MNPMTGVTAISALAESSQPRPFWSVMIPAYNPSRKYLEQALRSVLAQDPGAAQMQIEVVDDCSPKLDVAALVWEIAGDRVKVSQTPKNLGLAGCWNTCIERARGEWVHLLHQDDLVLPGFYERFEALNKRVSGLDAAFARHVDADADGHWRSLGFLEMRTAGELRGFDQLIAIWQRTQCAAVVVRRRTYEQLGGYRGDLPFVLDWEMWCRIAASGRWGYVPEPGAVYRNHPESETERLRSTGKTYGDLLTGGRLAREHFSPELQAQTASAFRDRFACQLMEAATTLYVTGALADTGRLLDSFRTQMLESKYCRAWRWLRVRVFIKSWLK